jgi:hypothetical protein
MVIPLRKFIEEYRRNPDEADFRLLTIACRRISKAYKHENFIISNTALTLGLSHSVLVNNSIADVDSLLYRLECQEDEYCIAVVPLLKKLTAEGCELESKGIKSPPSFLEKYSRLFTLLATVLGIITGILTILHW